MDDDAAPLNLGTADHALDLDVPRRLDNKAALHIPLDFDAAGKIDVSRSDVHAGVDHKMGVDTDLLPIIDNLPVDECNELMIVDNLCVFSLWESNRLSRLGCDILPEDILSRNPCGFGNAHSEYFANLRADKDIHIFVVHAVIGASGRTPLFSHIEFLFDPRIHPRFRGRAARCKKRGQTRHTAPNCLAVNAVDDLLCSKRIQHIGNGGRQIPLFFIKTHGCRHRIRRNLDGKWNDDVLPSILHRWVEPHLKAVCCAHDSCKLEHIVLRDAFILKAFPQRGKINDGAALTLRIYGKIVAIRFDKQLKPLAHAPNGTIHNTTPDPSNRTSSDAPLSFLIHARKRTAHTEDCLCMKL